ncbi:hypothetical protein B9Z19DRAFT_1193092 [Tuber borchii]|uniref:Uncharacterized protein n=1 Tax=Tuber borchii TaxID=42251 RepID=A0A2T6ZTC1_TUBBO|nr:hypothetical protein B9Z19DRAFT_1193092 [Tuber borchii]
MNPNLGIFSAALHERLQHILLEPEGIYGDRMREFQKRYKNSWYVPLDGYNWDTYDQLFSKGPLPPPWPDKLPRPDIRTTLSSEDVNLDLLFVGHLGKSAKSERCLPRSLAVRARPTATVEAIIDITEVATSDEIRKGQGIPKLPVINQDNVRVEEARRGIKLNVRPNGEAGLSKDPRPLKKLSYAQQKELKKTTAKVGKIEAIRDGKEPKLPRSLPTEEQVRAETRRKIAAMHPVHVDPNRVLPPEGIYSAIIEAIEEGSDQPQGVATGEERSTASASVRKEGDKSAARIWEEYESASPPDAELNPKNKAIPMSLLEMVPKVPRPSLSGPTPLERETNWLTFEWLLCHLFLLWACSVSSALRSLAPSAENILADLPAHQRIPPTNRVRFLEAHGLVNPAMAWTRWPFRDPGSQFEDHIERDFRSKTSDL